MSKEEEKSWLVLLLELPKIGKFLKLLVLLFPFVLASWFHIVSFGPGNWEPVIMALILIAWLVLLEKTLKLRFRVPLVRIPILWLTIALLLFAVWGAVFEKA